jgi:cell division protein FtsI/penicillin-binding protein 2
MRKRLFILLCLFLLAFGALLVRLFYWQVARGQSLSILAREQYQDGSSISAPRGEILASDGSWLAATADAWLLYASVPEITTKPQQIGDVLAPLFVDPKKQGAKELTLEESIRIANLLEREGAVWVPIKHKISSDIKNEIQDFGIRGLGFEQEEDRLYPEASSAAHLLGFVGKNESGEDQGYFGLEGYYNFVLSGKPGFVSREEDIRGVPILFGKNSKEVPPVAGVDLLTHIDKTVQFALEKKLKEGIERYGAISGSGVIMNPKDGAIIAMSAFPSYDPARYQDFSNELFLNPVISSSFEPGSVFKVLVMASALDSGVVKPDTKCPVCDKPFEVDGYYIRTWNDQYRPDSTMTDVIVNSDNVGMSFVGSRLGADRMYDYLSKFGVGSLTGVDLQGESTAKLRERGTWSQVDLATASFGQGVAVTPIQMIRAVAAIANGGVITTPQVVDKIVTDSWMDDVKPVTGERVISEKAAQEMTAMMVQAAEHGESKWTDIPGFKVAGKTGTAQIPIKGHYDADKTIASFVGFAPYDNPKFVMLITLQEPQSSPWASETAAPLWYSVAKEIFNYYGIQPE